MIIAAAVKLDNTVYIGRRHCNILQSLIKQNFNIKSAPQGFITTDGVFLDRKQGAIHAISCGQITKLKYQSKTLFSEDLW